MGEMHDRLGVECWIDETAGLAIVDECCEPRGAVDQMLTQQTGDLGVPAGRGEGFEQQCLARLRFARDKVRSDRGKQVGGPTFKGVLREELVELVLCERVDRRCEQLGLAGEAAVDRPQW